MTKMVQVRVKGYSTAMYSTVMGWDGIICCMRLYCAVVLR
jgi:hypothetical protein